MYTKFNVSLLLALFAYTPLAIKLGSRQEEDEAAVPNIAGAEEVVSGSEDEGTVTSVLEEMVEDATLEEIEEDDADPETLLNEFDDETAAIIDATEAVAEEIAADGATISADEAEEDDDCGDCCMPTCCDDDKDDTVNLPESVYHDGRIEQEAYALVEPLEPLIVDLTLEDLGLDLLDAENLSQDVLLPAMQEAINKMIAEDPSLAEGLPPLPTELESVVDQVMQVVQDNNGGLDFADVEGAVESEWSTTGTITDVNQLLDALSFSNYSPSVFWLIDDDCSEAGGACSHTSPRYEQWKDLQRNIIGTIFYKLNIDDVPEIDNMYANGGANSYLAFYDGETEWDSAVPEGEWYEFEATLARLNKEVADDAAEDEDWNHEAESVFDMQSVQDLNDLAED